MKNRSLPILLFICLPAITAVLLICGDSLLAGAPAGPGEEMVWTRWDPAHHTLLDDGQTLWIGTGSGLVRYNKSNGEHTRFSAFEGLPHQHVFAGAVDPAGNRWFGGDGGLSKLAADDTWTHYDTDDGLAANSVNGIALGAGGELWLSHGADAQVSHMDSGGGWSSFANKKQAVEALYTAVKGTINDNPLWAITGDEVWLGYEAYDGASWHTRLPQEAYGPPFAVTADSQGVIWTADSDYAFGWDGLQWSAYEYYTDWTGGLSAMTVAPDDAVWVGGQERFYTPYNNETSGVGRLPDEPGDITLYPIDTPPPVSVLMADQAGLWAAGPNWLLLPDGTNTMFENVPYLKNVGQVVVDGHDNTWIGSSFFGPYTAGRLQILDDKGTGTLSDDTGQIIRGNYPPPIITAIELAVNGDLWLTGESDWRFRYGYPPQRYFQGQLINFSPPGNYIFFHDIFAEDARTTWFVAARYQDDREVLAILRLDDGGTPGDAADDDWTTVELEKLGTEYNPEGQSWERVNGEQGNGPPIVAVHGSRLWFGRNNGVYLQEGEGWQKLTARKPYDLVPAADGTLLVNIGGGQVLVIAPDGKQYQESIAGLVAANPGLIRATTRRNSMWTVAPDGAIWYWGSGDQLVRWDDDGEKRTYENAPLGETIEVDANNHVWIKSNRKLWRMSPQPDFAISAPAVMLVMPKLDQYGNIVAVDISGFPDPVTLQLSDVPRGIRAGLYPKMVHTGEVAVLSISARGATLGDYALTVTGTSGDKTRSQEIKITVVNHVDNIFLPLIR